MKYRINRSRHFSAMVMLGLAAASSNAYAEGDYQALQNEVQALRQELSELRALVKQQSAAQDEVKNLRQEVKATSHAQSEAANADSVAHIAGYAAIGLTDRSQSGGSAFSVASFNPIFHFLYKDIAMAEAELEIAAAPDGTTETKLEYVSIDIFLNDNTTLVVDALIKAGKDFDLLLLPNLPHGYGPASNYMMRRRWDYFVTHLMGATPPKEYQIGPKNPRG